MEKDIVFKSSQILHSVSGISFLLLHNLFNFLVPQKMVNKALQQLLSNLQHGKFNWQMQLPWFFLSCSLICAALPNLFSGSLRSLRIFFFKITIIIIFIRGNFQAPPPPLFCWCKNMWQVYMHKFGRSKYEIYYKLLVFLTYHWSCYLELKVVKQNYP